MSLYHELERVIHKYRYTPGIEIEVRFGWNDREHKRFDTNIQERYYSSVLETLFQSYRYHNGFEEHQSSRDVVYQDPMTNTRVVMNNDQVVSVHKKYKLEVMDFEVAGTPFDIRIAVSMETPYQCVVTDRRRLVQVRTRDRNTFKYRMWNYDITSCVMREPMNNTNQVYEFEIELDCLKANTSNVPSAYLAESLFLKMNDFTQRAWVDNEKIHLKSYRLVDKKAYKA
jgi:hypothetical protein